VWPSVPATPDVCKLVCEWVVRNSARGRCMLCRRDLVAIYYSAWHRPFRFMRLRPNVCYAHSYTERSRDLPANPSKVTRQPGAYVPGVVHTWPNTFSVSGRHSWRTMPECNDLSQFREDTGEPSVTYLSENLIS